MSLKLSNNFLLNDWMQKKQTIERYILHHPDSKDAFLELLNINIQIADLNNAFYCISRILLLDPETPIELSWIEIAIETLNFEISAQWIEDLHNQPIEQFILQTKLKSKQGHSNQALEKLQHYYEQNQSVIILDTLVHLSILYQHPRASYWINKKLKNSNAYSDYFTIGKWYAEAKNYEKATEFYQQAKQHSGLEEKYPQLKENLLSQLEQNILSQSEHIEYLLQQEKQDLKKEELIHMGLFYLTKNNFEKFIEYYELAFTK